MVVGLVAPVSVVAADPSTGITQSALDGLRDAGDGAQVSTDNPSIGAYVGRIISQILVVISVVFFVLMVFGGVMWMTAGGSEERVTSGQRLLRNAIIGFMVTAAAFLITRFVTQVVYKAADPNFIIF